MIMIGQIDSLYAKGSAMNPREAYIVLNMLEGVGPVKVRALIEALGSPEFIFNTPHKKLIRIQGIGAELARRILDAPTMLDCAAEVQKASRYGIRIVTHLDNEYPPNLKEIHDPPLVLYIRGSLCEQDRHAVAIVGSRRASHYGRVVADRLAYQLAKVGFTVVSGLARGVDTAAHEGSLKGGGRTLAVIGSALDRLYPPENAGLADRIAKQGALLSEFPLRTEPSRNTFPIRNRIVSGLCSGIVVVEAGRKSGALITANEAMEQGRLVFAVPGRIDTPTSKGCHDLLKQGARLVDDIDDILDEFQYLIRPEQKERVSSLDQRPEVKLSESEQALVKALWDGPQTVDALTRSTGLSIAEISMDTMTLEMKRVVRMLPGRVVELADGIKPKT